MEPGEKQYLGDGVYVEFDGHGWELTAEQAHGTQRIYIDGPLDAKKLAKLMGLEVK